MGTPKGQSRRLDAGTTKTLDDIIRRKYAEIGVGADNLVDSEFSAKFTKAVIAELPAGVKVDASEVPKRVITLRKRGEDNGGLPRIERSYNGRDNHRPKQPR